MVDPDSGRAAGELFGRYSITRPTNNRHSHHSQVTGRGAGELGTNGRRRRAERAAGAGAGIEGLIPGQAGPRDPGPGPDARRADPGEDGEEAGPPALDRLQVLGPVRLWRAGHEVDLGPPKQRAVFCVLAMRMGRVHTVSELVEAIWGGHSPSSVVNSVHTYVSGLRQVLEPGRNRRTDSSLLLSGNGGYALALDGARIDAVHFEHCFTLGRDTAERHPATALTLYDRAVALWQGEAYSGVPGPFADAERVRLQEILLHLHELRAEAMLALARHNELVPEMQKLVAAHPLRERFRALLTLALYRSGRQSEALAVFRDTRVLLVRELGIEPGPEMQELNARVLAMDATLLEAPDAAKPGAGPAARTPPAQLPPALPDFVGRHAQLDRLRQFADAAKAGGTQLPGATVFLHGMAGVGKTALAVRFAHEAAAAWPGGRLYLDLHGFDPLRPPLTSAEALGYLLRSLGVDRDAVPVDFADAVAAYRTLTSELRALLVLDNAVDAEQVRPLLPGGACLTLVTSRRRLGGLVARDGAQHLTIRAFRRDESLGMLGRMIGEARVRADQERADELARLCGDLSLALRTAADPLVMDRRVRLAEVVEELRDERTRLDALAIDGDAASMIRPAFTQSYRLLPAEAAQAFRAVGRHGRAVIHVRDAARLSGVSEIRARQALRTLANAHMLEQAGHGRFRVHELLRLYAREVAGDRLPVPGPDAG